jgi:hypothetical protein
LDHSQQLIVTVQLQVGDVRRRPAVDDELVENLELFTFLHLVSGTVAIHGTSEAHPKIDTHTLVAHDAVQVVLVPLKLETGQEAEAAQAEGQHGRHNSLEQPRREENSPVTAERKY